MAKATNKAGNAASRAADAATTVRDNPYVQKLIEDEELRDNIRDAYEAARSAYQRATGSRKPVAKAVADDKKVQKDLRAAADSLRTASEQLRAPRKRGSNLGRLLMVAIAGAVLAVALSEDLRQAVLDKLFGAEEEFEYASTTAPSTTNSTGAATPAGAESTS